MYWSTPEKIKPTDACIKSNFMKKPVTMSESLGFEFNDRAEWRRWLADNHSEKNEVCVIIYKKGSKKRGLRYEEAVEACIQFELTCIYAPGQNNQP